MKNFFLAVLLLMPSTLNAQAFESASVYGTEGVASDIQAGRIFNWSEFGAGFFFNDATDVTSDIIVIWSFSTTQPSGFLYAANFPEAEVAYAPGIVHVSEVSDASSLTYEKIWAAGPVGVGEHAFFHNPATGFYAAMRIDAIDMVASPPEADTTWYIQKNGSADFSAMIFFDGFESGDLSFWSNTVCSFDGPSTFGDC